MRRERRLPALQNSAFREAARIALWSLVFTNPTVVALALLSSVFPTHLPDVLAWSAQGKDYAKQFSSKIATFLFAEVVVAQVFAIVTAAVVGQQYRGVIRQADIWHKVFAVDRPLIGRSKRWS
jgi:Family of unknown function (DUF6338)